MVMRMATIKVQMLTVINHQVLASCGNLSEMFQEFDEKLIPPSLQGSEK